MFPKATRIGCVLTLLLLEQTTVPQIWSFAPGPMERNLITGLNMVGQQKATAPQYVHHLTQMFTISQGFSVEDYLEVETAEAPDCLAAYQKCTGPLPHQTPLPHHRPLATTEALCHTTDPSATPQAPCHNTGPLPHHRPLCHTTGPSFTLIG
ncbi:unnamed protein product [Arctogadus glacialis]